ncbi:MAG: magnesium/cobalt transporter CorA [Gaiellaceae bacterium]
MTCRVVDRTGAAETELDRADLERRLEGGFFWLDLHRPTEAQLDLLRQTLGLHPLAIEDSLHFGQRPKWEEYDDVVFLVLYGHAPDEDGLVEVHCHLSERFLVSLRRDEAPGLDELHRHYEVGRDLRCDSASMLYHVSDSLVDSFFPALGRFDERLELIEDGLLSEPKQAHLQDVFTMRRRLAHLRKVILPQRDLIGRLAAGAVELPGMTREDERYFRDVYDHLIRLSEMMETTRETMTAAIDVYLSASSNRMNVVMKQLAVIATVFLPLSFVAGFFGQNFGWLVETIGGLTAFLVLGVGSQLLTLLVLLVFFKRRDWF